MLRSNIKIENLKRSYFITITKITMSSIQIYIPRILGTVTETEIKSVFPRMDIGDVDTIDMKYKINENKKPYYYAFININLYSTPRATTFKNGIIEYGMIRLLYDEEAAQYWEIKHHVDRSKRINIKLNTIVPFYKFSTLLKCLDINTDINTNTDTSTSTDVYKSYNMWDNSFDLLHERMVDSLC